jgi:calcium-dependent protein kinase
MAHQADDSEIDENKRIFIKLDSNNDGYVTKKELRGGLKNLTKMSDQEIDDIVKAMDTDKNGVVNYTEFVAATLKKEYTANEAKISAAFDMLDADGDGYIEEKELMSMIGSEVLGFDVKGLRTLIRQVDTDGDMKINVAEFRKMVTGK